MMAGWTMSVEAWIWMGAWALVMVLVVWLLVREPRRPSPDPTSILRDRFARGEISEGEFQHAIRMLEGVSAAARDAAAGVEHHASNAQEARYD